MITIIFRSTKKLILKTVKQIVHSFFHSDQLIHFFFAVNFKMSFCPLTLRLEVIERNDVKDEHLPVLEKPRMCKENRLI